MLDRELCRKFIRALEAVPSADSFSGRTNLMIGLPNTISIGRDENHKQSDLKKIVTGLDRLGRLTATGERPLVIVAENALMEVEDFEAGDTLKNIIRELKTHYGDEPPSKIIPAIPERLIFEGRDDRLPFSFVENALNVGLGVARVQVPRCFGGIPESGAPALGTGWLMGPGLIITNHHVIEARDVGEPPADESDFRIQAQKATVWFDYRLEGGSRIEIACAELLAADRNLDYAVLRLEDSDGLAGRSPLRIRPEKAPLTEGMRLNIVQHGGGGPLRYAIRNNFFVGFGDSNDQLRYVTDTEAGSSGSPVLDDHWRVVALHHAARPIPETEYRGETIKFHNQGVSVHAILKHLPAGIL